MKTFLLFIFFATQWAYAKPFTPMTEAQEKELRHIITVIQSAAHETAAKLVSAEAKASDAVLQLSAATDALGHAAMETQKVQGTLDTRTQERDEALADAALQAKWKWRWFWAFTGLSATVGIFLFLKLKSVL